ncbi:MAG: DUF4129 domain-containing protein [Tetrasphaera sp.]|nr:DUF4129 domain-containing protein [Tetrasphaera sp.]
MASPPVDPTSQEAREWLVNELSKSGYSAKPSLIERFLDWLGQLLSFGSGGASLPGWLLGALIGVALGVVVLVALRIARPEAFRKRRTGGGYSAEVLDDSGRTAAHYRRDAAAALARGDLDLALCEAVRAIAAGATERTLLPESPGRTAHELSGELSQIFPAEAVALRGVADTFDAVRYGRRPATAEGARAAIALDARLVTTAPLLTRAGVL